MERKNQPIANEKRRLAVLQRSQDLLARSSLAKKMGWSYGGDRKIYDALGYPDENELTFQYYWNKYTRQEIATAIIDKPVEATWSGNLVLTEEGTQPSDSKLLKEWEELDNQFKIKSRLVKLDKLTGIGQFSLLLFGFDDVKEPNDWQKVATGKRTLMFLKQLPESDIEIHTTEKNSSNPRYGLPVLYKIRVSGLNEEVPTDLLVHHSRVLHIMENNLTSEVYGRPRLKPIINRLNDLEKLLGGDAEMFWRGARPGYHAAAQEDYEMGADEVTALEDELDKYEHDLRRFISAKGVDIKALEQQIADPSSHVDVQLQAISAQTNIPKRILVGSERGELSSSQDTDQWLGLIQTRMNEFAEPSLLRPLIDKLMEHKILTPVKVYVVIWEDVFAPSELQKATVGEQRAKALKVYAESPYATEILPPQLAYKYLLGLNDDQVTHILAEVDLVNVEEDRLLSTAAEEEAIRLEKEKRNQPVEE